MDLNVNEFTLITTHFIMAPHLNAAGSLFGGLLVQWVDEAASVYAMKIVKSKRVVTRKISELLYNQPARLGDILGISFRLSEVGTTSITLECVVDAQEVYLHDKEKRILECQIVFVHLDEKGNPTPHKLPKSLLNAK